MNASFIEYLWKMIPAAARPDALRQANAIEVTIERNDFGGWSIYPANQAALCLFGGNAPTGNFGCPADARRRAERDNCWTVIEPRAAHRGRIRQRLESSATLIVDERAGVTAAAVLSRS
jgi:hypothetical protein